MREVAFGERHDVCEERLDEVTRRGAEARGLVRDDGREEGRDVAQEAHRVDLRVEVPAQRVQRVEVSAVSMQGQNGSIGAVRGTHNATKRVRSASVSRPRLIGSMLRSESYRDR